MAAGPLAMVGFESSVADGLISPLELRLGSAAGFLLLVWPFAALPIARAIRKPTWLVLGLPYSAAAATAGVLLGLLWLEHRGFEEGELAALTTLLMFSGLGSATAVAVMFIGKGAELLKGPTATALTIACALLLLASVLGLPQVPFGRTASGLWIDPNPVVAYVPIAVTIVAALVMRLYARWAGVLGDKREN